MTGLSGFVISVKIQTCHLHICSVACRDREDACQGRGGDLAAARLQTIGGELYCDGQAARGRGSRNHFRAHDTAARGFERRCQPRLLLAGTGSADAGGQTEQECNSQDGEAWTKRNGSLSRKHFESFEGEKECISVEGVSDARSSVARTREKRRFLPHPPRKKQLHPHSSLRRFAKRSPRQDESLRCDRVCRLHHVRAENHRHGKIARERGLKDRLRAPHAEPRILQLTRELIGTILPRWSAYRTTAERRSEDKPRHRQPRSTCEGTHHDPSARAAAR